MNLKQFYEPHPGLAGALVEIPPPVRMVAEKLDGRTLPLDEAVARIKAVTDGTVDVRGESIGLSLPMASGVVHMYVVIKFRDPAA